MLLGPCHTASHPRAFSADCCPRGCLLGHSMVLYSGLAPVRDSKQLADVESPVQWIPERWLSPPASLMMLEEHSGRTATTPSDPSSQPQRSLVVVL